MQVAKQQSSFLEIKAVRFAAVGMANTLIDLVIFTVLRFSGVPVAPANIFSTSVALLSSLLLNYRFTFQGHKLTVKLIALYIVVTLIGLWVLQPIVIYGVLELNSAGNYIETAGRIFGGREELFVILVPKLIATVVTLVWNYLWYSRVVFYKRSTKVLFIRH